ncbi:MAG: protein kinase [Burkholderiales bacterium]
MASQPQTARRIGRFDVLRALGRGTQGTVWLAHDPDLKRDVAIKTIEVDGATDPAAVKDLLDEAIMMSRLVHPNIVTLFDAGRDGDEPYLVFEYVPGDTLSSVIKTGGAMEPHKACNLAIQMLKGVEFAHQKGVVHRDLKPGNVMVTEDGIPRIMDFGIAALISGEDPGDEGFHGTPAYTAPEYVNERQYSPKSDVFSVGVVLHEMLTGEPCVSGNTVFELLHKITSVEFEPPSRKAGTVDEALDAIVMRALVKDPANRFQSAQEMTDALEKYLRPVQVATEPAKESVSGTLEFLLRRIRVKSDFPALSHTISTVSQTMASDKEGVTKLSGAVIKDFALTNKLLKMVNAAHYGQRRGISTVSRAIMVLGFDQVRSIAVSLMLFDHMQNRSQAVHLRDTVISAYLSAIVGRSLAGAAGLRDTEEAFICSMFHSLGRLLSAFYFHEESLEIHKLMHRGTTEREAAIEILGAPLDELGVGVAKSWNFPENVLASMRQVNWAKVDPPTGDADKLRFIAELATNIADVIRFADEGQREARLMELEERFQPMVGVKQTQIISAVGHAVSDIARDAKVLDLKTAGSLFFEKAVAWFRHFHNEEKAEELDRTLAGAKVPIPKAAPVPGAGTATANGTPIAAPPPPPEERRAALSAGIEDLANVLKGKFQLNDVLRIIVETMFRAGGFTRVMLLLRDPANNALKARIGLGDGAESAIAKGFSVSLAPTKDVFFAALSRGVDICIEDVDNEKVRTLVPGWYRKTLPARSFALFPIMLGPKAVALLYGDNDQLGQLALGPEELSLLKSLRNQAVAAIRAQHG